jgi:hypothetical protein
MEAGAVQNGGSEGFAGDITLQNRHLTLNSESATMAAK